MTQIISKVKYSLGLFLAILSLGSTTGRGCIALAVDANGNPVPTLISGEQAVIIWDEAHKTEHFIRQADIGTTGTSVGFIVPTPQTPKLVEADPMIFGVTAEAAAPEFVPRTEAVTPLDVIVDLFKGYEIKSVYSTITSQLAVALAPTGVEVISEQDIANYHATVLAADDSASLEQWLKQNGYTWSKDDDAWLQPYLAAKWKITAFKLIPTSYEKGAATVKSKAIRMSFATDRPFFPYSEPHNGNAPNPAGRSLNIAILSGDRMSGKLDDGHAWPGELKYSGPLDSSDPVSQFIAFAKFDPQKETVSAPTHLTYFADNSNPRPGTCDLYFSTGKDQSFFRKTVVDPNLPPVAKIDWSDPVADAAALLLVGLPVLFVVTLFLRRSKR